MSRPTDERDADRAELLRQLGQQVEQLTSSDEWVAWLDIASRFHNYSFGNQMLIAMQRPDATRVAGFRTWLTMGRHVRKGEKGIKILAPMVMRAKDVDNDEGADTKPRVFFRVVHVFDIAQTDGDDLPEMVWPVLADGPACLFERLVGVAQDLGLTVETTSTSANGARGWYQANERKVTVVDTFPAASMARTMLHELSHSLDPACNEGAGIVDRAERELIAESAAYIVGKRLGLDSDECATFYTASWGADAKKLTALAERVLAIAEQLESAITMRSEQVAA